MRIEIILNESGKSRASVAFFSIQLERRTESEETLGEYILKTIFTDGFWLTYTEETSSKSEI